MDIRPFQLERYFARYEFSARYLLCSSDCESVPVRDLLALEADAESRLHDLWLGYTESSGSPTLRQAISLLYPGIDPGQVLVHSGAEEAIFNFMQANLHAGDHVIVHQPCYQSLFEVAASIGCRVSAWQAREENQWRLDLDELKSLLRPETRLVVLNTPHNPTGFLMPRADFLELNRYLSEKEIWLFSDEVYRESEQSEALRLPAACQINPLAVSLGVVSKTYGLAGLRIGWIATQERGIYDRMAAMKDYTSICSSAPSEFLAELALRHRQKLIDRNLAILRSNLQLLGEFFAAHTNRFRWLRPQAGSVAFPALLGRDVDAFCHELVNQKGVMLLPGSLFADQGNHFRIGFGRRNLPEALEKLEEFLDEGV